MVAVDKNGKSSKVKPLELNDDTDRRRFKEAEFRKELRKEYQQKHQQIKQ